MTPKIPKKNLRLTLRDEAILTDLYFTRLLTTEQIRARHFKAFNTAKSRLYDIRDMRYIEPSTPYRGLTVWMLTRGAFEREIEDLRREDESYKTWPKPKIIPHFVDTNDVFVGVAGELDRLLGGHPAWEWKDERRMVGTGSRTGKKKDEKLPDAEIAFSGNRYFLERQTERARATRGEIEEKIDGHRRYVQRLEERPGAIELLFACDKDRDMDYALEAAQKHQVAMTAGTPQQIIEHLIEQAQSSATAETAA